MAKKLGIIGENGNLDPYASLNGSKHIIRDASGAKPDENLLEFSNGLDVTDDPTNGKTIVAPNKSLVRQNEIASYILDGDKPSTALSSGKFFVDKNGLLRVANTNISTTDDVTDSNSSVKSIGDVLTELNSNLGELKYYSANATTDTIVGTLSDGRPVYRHVFEGTFTAASPLNSWQELQSTDINPRRIIEMVGILYNSSTGISNVAVFKIADGKLSMAQNWQQPSNSANYRVIVKYYLPQ